MLYFGRWVLIKLFSKTKASASVLTTKYSSWRISLTNLVVFGFLGELLKYEETRLRRFFALPT